MRLAIMPFGAFVGDQQMPSGLKAIFESLAQGNSYRVGLYRTPIRQPATSNIGRRNRYDRWRRGRKAGKADADVIHSYPPDPRISSLLRSVLFLPTASKRLWDYVVMKAGIAAHN